MNPYKIKLQNKIREFQKQKNKCDFKFGTFNISLQEMPNLKSTVCEYDIFTQEPVINTQSKFIVQNNERRQSVQDQLNVCKIKQSEINKQKDKQLCNIYNCSMVDCDWIMSIYLLHHIKKLFLSNNIYHIRSVHLGCMPLSFVCGLKYYIKNNTSQLTYDWDWIGVNKTKRGLHVNNKFNLNLSENTNILNLFCNDISNYSITKIIENKIKQSFKSFNFLVQDINTNNRKIFYLSLILMTKMTTKSAILIRIPMTSKWDTFTVQYLAFISSIFKNVIIWMFAGKPYIFAWDKNNTTSTMTKILHDKFKNNSLLFARDEIPRSWVTHIFDVQSKIAAYTNTNYHNLIFILDNVLNTNYVEF